MSVYTKKGFPSCGCRVPPSWEVHQPNGERREKGLIITTLKCQNCSTLGREYCFTDVGTNYFIVGEEAKPAELSTNRYVEERLWPLVRAEVARRKSVGNGTLATLVPPPCKGLRISYQLNLPGEKWQLVVSADPEVNELIRRVQTLGLDEDELNELLVFGAVADRSEMYERCVGLVERRGKDPDIFLEKFS